MKKTIALIPLCLLFALSACGKTYTAAEELPVKTEQVLIDLPEPTPSDEPEPTPEPTPAWESGIAAGYGIGVLYAAADRGTPVEITGEEGDYYTVLFEGTELYVEKRFVRDASEPQPEGYTAYAKNGAEIYAGPYLTGDPLEKPRMNSALTVVDAFGDLMLVRTDKAEGYIRSALVSPVWISWQTGGDQGQNSGGGNNSAAGGTDGGDITLGGKRTPSAVPVLLSAHYEELQSGNKNAVRGVILADGTELYLGIVYPGDELMVLSAESDTVEIYTSRGTGTLPRWAVLMGDEEPYKTWKGYAYYGARLYDSFRMTGGYADVYLNTEMTVILETDGGLFVRLPDGRYGYLGKTCVTENATVIYYEEPDSDPAAEWTVPVL